MNLPTKLFAVLCASTGLAVAATPTSNRPAVVHLPDQAAVTSHFRALGHLTRRHGDRATIAKAANAQGGEVGDDSGAYPTFTSSFTVGGVTYPFTMIGHAPRSGRSTTVKSVIVPLRMTFYGFAPNPIVFEPAPAVANIMASPMYQQASFPNGTGQFVDQMQRAAFWNQMDPDHSWHVRMAPPEVAETVDIEVTPETGTISTDSNGNNFGDVLIDFLDAEALTIMQFMDLPDDVLPIFVTDNVTAEALGYHSVNVVQEGGTTHLQPYIYTSWLDPALVDPIIADISTINHEMAEFTNDPFVINVVPDWMYPPPSDPASVCSGNPYLEVGDPQGNGPTYADFPTIGVPIDGVTYHLQQLVLWQWFTDQVPSSAYGGWYTFPYPPGLTVPAVYCP